MPERAGYVGRHVMASPEYFSVMGIDLLAGRLFAPTDHFFAPRVAVISETFARRYGLRPDQAVGRRAVLDHRWVDIVGVVRDVRTGGPTGGLDATAYVPFAQRQAGGPLQFVVKAMAIRLQLIAAARAAGGASRSECAVVRHSHVRSDPRSARPRSPFRDDDAVVVRRAGVRACRARAVCRRQLPRPAADARDRHPHGDGRHDRRGSHERARKRHCTLPCRSRSRWQRSRSALSQLLSSRLRDLGELDLVTLSVVSAAFLASAALAAWLPARRATLIDPVQALRFD